MYAIITLLFIPLGVVILVQSTRLYSSPFLSYSEGGMELVRVVIDQEVKGPSYFYYGITNFYQNARRYIDSRSDPQLRGAQNPDTSTCEPAEFENDSKTVLVPCGLVAQSFFNDSFELFKTEQTPSEANKVSLSDTNIAWDIDRNERFASKIGEFDISQDFMVWMRVSAYRNWKKLYRIITDDLTPGDYLVRVNSTFPVSEFGGQKFFFISETTWFGGPNIALGIVYITVGAIALVVAIVFSIRSRMTQDLDLPPETTVHLDGLVKHPFNGQESSESQQETV